MTREKILIVDDNTINRKTLSIMLERLGEYEVFQADNGINALEIYKSERPDIIFMDIQMPIMNGVECAVEIRKIEKHISYKNAIIIAITAYDDHEMRGKCHECGMDGFIAKPYKVNDINFNS